MRVLKKISVSTVFGRITSEQIAALKENGGEIAVGRFYGLASGFKQGTTQFGVWTGLTGAFRAVDAATGELCSGPVLLLPMGIAEQVVESAIRPTLENGDTPSVAVAVDIFVKYRQIAGEDKYEYIARSNEVPPQDDPLEKLGQSLGELPKNPLLLESSAQSEQPAIENSAAAKTAKKK